MPPLGGEAAAAAAAGGGGGGGGGGRRQDGPPRRLSSRRRRMPELRHADAAAEAWPSPQAATLKAERAQAPAGPERPRPEVRGRAGEQEHYVFECKYGETEDCLLPLLKWIIY